jgi:hypothetical protein
MQSYAPPALLASYHIAALINSAAGDFCSGVTSDGGFNACS